MKKILLIVLEVAALVSCSKNEAEELPNGQYIHAKEDMVIAINVDRGKCRGITIFREGRFAYQELYLATTSGTYPAYIYDFEKMVLQCNYTGINTFYATILTNDTGETMPDLLVFKQDNRVLDVNGDGILDQ